MASALAEAHIEAERRLRLAVVAAVERIWRSLPGFDRENVDEWLSLVVPVVRAGQLQSVALTEGYLARALGRRPWLIERDELVNPALRGVSLEEQWQRPFVTHWTALKDGRAFADAANAGRARATDMAAFDVQSSMRATANAVQQADGGIFGYTRRTDTDPCDFCRLVDGAYVKSADAFPLHPNCGCGLEPLTEPHRLAVFLPDGTRIRRTRGGPLVDTPTPPGVAVRNHGELGPVLGSADHDFTSQSDF